MNDLKTETGELLSDQQIRQRLIRLKSDPDSNEARHAVALPMLEIAQKLVSLFVRNYNDREFRNDVEHDLYLHFFEKVDQINPDNNFEGWAKKTALHFLINYYKKEAKNWECVQRFEQFSENEDECKILKVKDEALEKFLSDVGDKLLLKYLKRKLPKIEFIALACRSIQQMQDETGYAQSTCYKKRAKAVSKAAKYMGIDAEELELMIFKSLK